MPQNGHNNDDKYPINITGVLSPGLKMVTNCFGNRNFTAKQCCQDEEDYQSNKYQLWEPKVQF